MIHIALILCSFLKTSLTLAAANPGIYFYLTPESAFPSGQVHRGDLEKYSLKEHQRMQFLGQRAGIKFWISPDEITRDIDVAFRVMDVRSKTIYWILEIDHGVAKTYNEVTGLQEKIDVESLTPLADDLGVAIPYLQIPIRQEASWKSETLYRAQSSERLRILRVDGDWVLVSPLQAPEKKGWAELSGLITRFDFATHILPIGEKWTEVQHRRGGEMISTTGSVVPLKNIRALITEAEKGLALRNLKTLNIPARAPIDLIKPKSKEWIESNLPGHGRVFWKRDVDEWRDPEEIKPMILSTEGILKRSITSVGFHPKEAQFGLASAEGIFMTRDGFIWEQLPFFERKNYPVAVSDEGHLFVGPYRSTDQGISFFPYLKWESISKLDQEWSSLRHHPILRLIHIEPLKKQEVRIVLNNGLRTWRMKGTPRHGAAQTWSFE